MRTTNTGRPAVRAAAAALVWVFAAALVAGCDGDGGSGGGNGGNGTIETLNVLSGAFDDGGTIPEAYTCKGAGHTPPLAWTGAPADTRTFAIIVEDPDVPVDPADPSQGTVTLDHWVVYDIPATTQNLPDGATGDALPPEARVASGWFGPCPPEGTTHRYEFRVYAVDTALGIDPSSLSEGLSGNETAADRLREALEGHIVGQGLLTGRFE